MNLIYFTIVICILVFVHEWGHYRVARLLKIGVQRFSIGMGKVIYRHRSKKTGVEWVISLLPLGGYVLFTHDPAVATSDPRNDPTEQIVGDEKTLPNPLKPGEKYFTDAKPWERILVAFAGPFANLVFAVILFTAVAWTDGQTIVHNQIATPAAQSWAAQLGLKANDAIAGASWQEENTQHHRTFTTWNDWQNWQIEVRDTPVDHVRLEFLRQSPNLQSPVLIEVPIDWERVLQQSTRMPEAILGIYPRIDGLKIENFDKNSSLRQAGAKVGDTIAFIRLGDQIVAVDAFDNLKSALAKQMHVEVGLIKPSSLSRPSVATAKWLMVKLQNHRLGAYLQPVGGKQKKALSLSMATQAGLKQVHLLLQEGVALVKRAVTFDADKNMIGGPITIAKESGKAAQYGFAGFVVFLAMLSVSLGFINLLPIPVLDGGQILLNTLEWIRGKPLSTKITEWVTRIGLAMVLMMMTLAIMNDVKMIFEKN